MRISCNGCRVLRKGCSDECSLRPCLQWIKSSESQANATVFLAKFYGRAGLMNLINAGPQHLRPGIFLSLLFEACGRIVNPIYGSVGLLCSSNWDRCQAAVDAVLNGSPIMQVPSDDDAAAAAAAANHIMPLKAWDIRQRTKDSNDPNRVESRNRFKRPGGRGRNKSQLDSFVEFTTEPAGFSISGWGGNHPEELNQTSSHDSSMFSIETVEPSLANRVVKSENRTEDSEVELKLSLGFNPVLRPPFPTVEPYMIDLCDGDA